MAEFSKKDCSGSLSIEPMVELDVDEMYEIETQCFSSPWPRRSFSVALRDPLVWIRTARLDEALIGYVIVVFRGLEVLIANLAVRPECRNRGIGRRLIREGLRESRRCGAAWAVLDVRSSNDRAIALYESEGFEVVGRRKSYYSDPAEDSVVMRRLLADGRDV